MRQLKSNGCIVCGEKDQACLDFHHLHNKSFTIGNQCKDKGISSIKNEVDKWLYYVQIVTENFTFIILQ